MYCVIGFNISSTNIENLSGGSKYNITVYVNGNFNGRISSTYKLLEISNDINTATSSATSLQNPSYKTTIQYGIIRSIRYNPSDKIILNASVSVTSSEITFCEWSSPSSEISNLQEISKTPINISRSGVISETLVFQLTLLPNSLTSSLSYIFTLNSYSKGILYDVSSIVILINRPPYGGGLSVTPGYGIEYNTSFLFHTYDWVDDIQDYPLR